MKRYQAILILFLGITQIIVGFLGFGTSSLLNCFTGGFLVTTAIQELKK
jgi:hypothetical protein